MNVLTPIARASILIAFTISLLLPRFALAAHATPTRIASWTDVLPPQASLLRCPAWLQQHSLTCEAASLGIAMDGQPDEAQIAAAMPRNPNPYLGFRGNIDGRETLSNGLADYGIYAPALAVTAHALGLQTRVFGGPQAPALLRYAIGVLHRPVVVWVTYKLQAPRIIWGQDAGATFPLVLDEHANTVIGYDAGGVTVRDPLRGTQFYSWAAFEAAWIGAFQGMSLLAGNTLEGPILSGRGRWRRGREGTWTWDHALPGSVAVVALWRGARRVASRTLLPAGTSGFQSVTWTLLEPGRYSVLVRSSAPLSLQSPAYRSGALIIPALTPIARPPATTTASPTANAPSSTATPLIKLPLFPTMAPPAATATPATGTEPAARRP